jgi:alpha-galactosidase
MTIQFLLYPDLPVVRKNLEIKNLSSKTAMVESVDVEKFDVTGYSASTFSWIAHDYGRRRSIGPYNGNMQDALVTVHNSDWEPGHRNWQRSLRCIKNIRRFSGRS